jgi:hypothetical protein
MPVSEKQQKQWEEGRGWNSWRWYKHRFPDWKEGDKIPDFPIGEQYYKSGFMVKEPERKGLIFKKRKRWFQLRHHYLFYYADDDEQGYYNTPARQDDDPAVDESSLLDFDFEIKLPSLPSLPSLSMPDMPDMPDMPSVSMPSMSMPSMSMPSMSMPSLSMPSLGKMPKLPKKKEKPGKGRPYGLLLIYNNCTVTRKGKDIILDGCNKTIFWAKDPNEDKKNQHVELHCDDVEDAKSWYLSLAYGGAKKGGES